MENIQEILDLEHVESAENIESIRTSNIHTIENISADMESHTLHIEIRQSNPDIGSIQSISRSSDMESVSNLDNQHQSHHINDMKSSINMQSSLEIDTTDVSDLNPSIIHSGNASGEVPCHDQSIEIATQIYASELGRLHIQLEANDVENDNDANLIGDIENLHNLQVNEEGELVELQVEQINLDYLVFECYKDFEDAFRDFQKETLTSFCTAHNTKDFAKFMTLEEILSESKEDCTTGLPYIRWEFQTGGLPLPYLGYPFISVGHAKYDCSQGKDRNVSRKEKYRIQREEAKDRGVLTQTRILSRPTKKMGCPVSMCCKKIYAFPDFAILKDTKRNRSVASLKLRKLFEGILSQSNVNIKVEEGKPALGTLLYITKFPDPQEHKYHLEFSTMNVSNMSGIKQLYLHVGSVFSSLKDAEEALDSYRAEHNLRLYCSVKESYRNEHPLLKYSQLTYRCLYAVKEQQRSKTLKPCSFKQGCEMHIRFGVSDDGSQLVVKSMSEEHNHEINEETIVKEALHPELCSYVSKLVWSDINIGIDEVKRRLENYVCDEMFKDQTPPPRTRRQYFPSKKQIRYFMAKAKASLNISQEAEIKLEAQAEKLKETRGDEKMIFNFKVSHDNVIPSELTINNEEGVGDADDEFFTRNNPTHGAKPVEPQLVNEVHNAKILFCHQTPHQQRLMRRYSSQLILTQISDIHSKIPFPLFCLYVQSNVDFQLVGEFILQANTSSMIMEGLQTFKEWNPGWNPKFVIVDFSEEQISAVESVFPGTFVLISDSSREKAWSDWLSVEENEVYEHKEEITSYLQAIANAYSEDTLNTAARELEESDVWKMSDKLRNWFQINWLSQAKRWVAGYRPDDYLMVSHHGRTLDMELKAFKSIKLVNKSAPLQDVIQQIVEHVAPVARKQYELMNQESVKLQNQLKYLYSDIPNYLACRPGKLTYHVYERLKLASEQSYTLSYLHPGIFSVQCCGGDDDILHTVSFGDSNSFPSCDCHDWQRYKLPCVHLCAVFNSYPGWTWDMLSVAYKSSPVLNVDWTFVPENSEDLPGDIVDKSTQTSDATLISNSPQLSRMGKMADSRRLTETPQVLASQCRGLLQQLSKLQLAHHSRDNLYRLKSELKELISMFSNAPKQKTFTPVSLTDTYVIQSKGPGRPRKIVPTDIQPEAGVQSVFEQYNVTPVTPRQVNDAGERKIYPSRSNRTSSSQLVISRPPGEPSTSQDQDNSILGTVYIVDPTRVLVSAKDKNSSQNIITHNQLQSITNNQLQSAVKLKSNPPIVRKRIQSPSVFLKPPDKRMKGGDMMAEHEPNFDGEVPLEFSQENVDDTMRGSSMHDDSLHDEGLHDDALLTVDEDSSISSVIDSQPINIQLEQVSVTMGETDNITTSDMGSTSIQTSTLEADSIESAIDSIDAPSSEINAMDTPSSVIGTTESHFNTIDATENHLGAPESDIDSVEASSSCPLVSKETTTSSISVSTETPCDIGCADTPTSAIDSSETSLNTIDTPSNDITSSESSACAVDSTDAVSSNIDCIGRSATSIELSSAIIVSSLGEVVEEEASGTDSEQRSSETVEQSQEVVT